MATTPPAAKMSDDDGGKANANSTSTLTYCGLDLMQVDRAPVRPGDEADVESEGGTVNRKSNSGTSKDAKVASKPASTARKTPVEIPDDDEEEEEEDEDGDEDEADGDEADGDEETYAVESILNHGIDKKPNVTRPCLILR